MPQKPLPYVTIDEYIAQYPPDIQKRLSALRGAIRQAAPDAEEGISWAMPTYKLAGNLVHFAAGKHHIGLYPGESGVAHFQNELSGYKTSKGAIQFPNDAALPLALVKKIVRFRAKENQQWAREKAAAKSKK